MPSLLAIDTATEALSLALLRDGERRALHRVMPRQQQQQLFRCLDELLNGESNGESNVASTDESTDESIADLGLDAVVYGRGPGSFTGLRIATSAAQGLAFALDIPVIGISTLETQVRTWLRGRDEADPCLLISTIDARIGQSYLACYLLDSDGLQTLAPASLVAPGPLALPAELRERTDLPLFALGSGFALLEDAAPEFDRLQGSWPDLLPEAQDMLEPALAILAAGEALPAEAAVPDYVQQRIGWKTLAEQGRRA